MNHSYSTNGCNWSYVEMDRSDRFCEGPYAELCVTSSSPASVTSDAARYLFYLFQFCPTCPLILKQRRFSQICGTGGGHIGHLLSVLDSLSHHRGGLVASADPDRPTIRRAILALTRCNRPACSIGIASGMPAIHKQDERLRLPFD